MFVSFGALVVGHFSAVALKADDKSFHLNYSL